MSIVTFSSITTATANTEVENSYPIQSLVSTDLTGRAFILDSVSVQYVSASATALVGAIAQVRLMGEPFTSLGDSVGFASQQARALSNVNAATCSVTSLRAMKVPIPTGGTTEPRVIVSLLTVVPAVFQLRIRVNIRVTVDASYTMVTPTSILVVDRAIGAIPEDPVVVSEAALPQQTGGACGPPYADGRFPTTSGCSFPAKSHEIDGLVKCEEGCAFCSSVEIPTRDEAAGRALVDFLYTELGVNY